jgi:hypothetical protein
MCAKRSRERLIEIQRCNLWGMSADITLLCNMSVFLSLSLVLQRFTCRLSRKISNFKCVHEIAIRCTRFWKEVSPSPPWHKIPSIESAPDNENIRLPSTWTSNLLNNTAAADKRKRGTGTHDFECSYFHWSSPVVAFVRSSFFVQMRITGSLVREIAHTASPAISCVKKEKINYAENISVNCHFWEREILNELHLWKLPHTSHNMRLVNMDFSFRSWLIASRFLSSSANEWIHELERGKSFLWTWRECAVCDVIV